MLAHRPSLALQKTHSVGQRTHSPSFAPLSRGVARRASTCMAPASMRVKVSFLSSPWHQQERGCCPPLLPRHGWHRKPAPACARRALLEPLESFAETVSSEIEAARRLSISRDYLEPLLDEQFCHPPRVGHGVGERRRSRKRGNWAAAENKRRGVAVVRTAVGPSILGQTENLAPSHPAFWRPVFAP